MFKHSIIAICLCVILGGGVVAEAKVVTFTTSDGVQIEADYFPVQAKDGQKSPVAILVHMYPADRKSWQVLAPELGVAGYSVLAYDIRGKGGSTTPASMGLAERYAGRDPSLFADAWKDLEAAKKWLQTQKDCDTSRIAIIGASVGSSIALQYGLKDKDVRTIVCLSPGIDYFGIDSKAQIAANRGKRLLLIAPEAEYAAVEELVVASRGLAKGLKYAGTREQHGTGMFHTAYGKELKAQIINWLNNLVANSTKENAKKAQKARQAITPRSTLAGALKLYKSHTGTYPEKLEYLVNRPKGSSLAARWKGPYVKDATVITDPWGRPYGYRIAGPELHNKGHFDLWSVGPDGKTNTDDDIKNWR